MKTIRPSAVRQIYHDSAAGTCPVCGKTGKPVQRQTLKSMLAVSLRELEEREYLFCGTQTCSVVYFSVQGEQTFAIDHVRERVYQKEPDAQDVFLCYCFRHTTGELRSASPTDRMAIIDNIHTSINAGQCACELRNPQGSCCLGNVRSMVKQLEQPAVATA